MFLAVKILFGIKGKRWEEIDYIAKYINEYYVYPEDSTKPKGYEKIENGCYWS